VWLTRTSRKPTQAALLSDLVDVEEDEDDVADRLEKELKKDLTSSGTAAASLLRCCLDVGMVY
jgi:hypothetical protein